MADRPEKYHTIIARRVNEEEQVSIESWVDTQVEAQTDTAKFLAMLREHRNEHNKAVLEMHENQVRALVSRREATGESIRELDAQIEVKRMELEDLNKKIAKKVRSVG